MKIKTAKPTGDILSVCEGYGYAQDSIKNMEKSFNTLTKTLSASHDRIAELDGYLENGLAPVGMSKVEMLNEIVELTDLISTQNDKLKKLKSEAYEDKKYYSQIEGGNASYILESRYNELIEAYSDANPGIQFVRMPLDQSYLAISDKELDALNPTMSAILSINTPGIGELPVLKDLYEGGATETSAPLKLPGIVFTDSISGNLVFSAIGICPLIADYGLNLDDFNISDVPSLQASVLYQYQAQVTRKHKVEFNLHQLAQRIEKISSKGGFLRRKNVHQLTEKTEHESWIKITSLSEDVNFEFSDEYTASVVQEHMAQFLESIAHVRFSQPGTYPSAGLPTEENGADVGANALSKCPHMYCQIGSYSLKFISSTFGQKTALSEYLKTEDAWTSREVEEKKMVPMVGSYSFE